MSFPFDAKEGLIVVRTRIWGPSHDFVVRLALDTGANRTLVGWDIMALLGYDPASVHERSRMTTGSGVEYVPRLPIRRLAALGRTRRNFPVVCHTLPPSASIDGLLGLDFFRETRLALDFRAGTIALD